MKHVLSTVAAALFVASCSPVSEEGPRGEADELGTFEQRNINAGRDDANDGPGARRAEHAFARIALDCVHQQYPNKISHVMTSAADVAEPAKLTPAFYGCFDWHSAVHGHWLLTRLWGQDLVPDMDAEIEAALGRSFTAENIAGEVAYFNGEDRGSFERPYGIAWFLQLTAELHEIAKAGGPKAQQAAQWLERLRPLETIIVANIEDWVPKLAYPIRIGTHNQSAFAFGLFLDWARATGNEAVETLIAQKARGFHLGDENCPLGYEPSGEDFLSPCLMEADLMRRVMEPAAFAAWLSDFLPDIPTDGRADWLEIGIVNDPTDGKLVHLDGVNLSRAWALRGIASALPEGDPRRASLMAAADTHAAAGEKSVATPHYAGSHWLASFATYLRTNRGIADEAPSEGATPTGAAGARPTP